MRPKHHRPHTRFRLSDRLPGAGAVLALLAAGFSASAAGSTVLVLDASGSMWGQIDGAPKISIARDVIDNLLDELPAEEPLGLVAYGHRRKGDCADIEQLVPPTAADRERIRAAVGALNPKGKTPLSDAVRLAAESLRYVEERATVVLVSDGIETCDRDPCATGAELEAAGVDLTVHVVGFDVADEAARSQLRCLAENTGGNFYPASDASGLKSALGEVAATVVAAPAPEYPEIDLVAPDTVTVGETFEVARSATVAERDIIAVAPAGAKDDALGNRRRVSEGNPLSLRAHAEPGSYEIRYVVEATREVIGRRPIEFVDAAVELDAPDTVIVGSEFEVVRDRTVNDRDRLAIVTPDAKDDRLGNTVRVGRDSVAVMRAPAAPGLYELRYVLAEGRRVIGRRPIEVIAAELSLQVPASVTAGAVFQVTRSGTVNGLDLVTIVPADAADRELGNRVRVRDDLAATLTAPAEPGLYEVRYVLDAGRAVVAREPVEVLAATVTLEAPASVVAGSTFEVGRSGTVNARDLITIVAQDAKDGELGNRVRARSNAIVTLTAPAEPGLYEVRYVLDAGRRTIARAAVEVLAAAVTLEAPESVVAGSTFEVGRSGTVNARDLITIVAQDAKDGELGNRVRARSNAIVTLTAPAEPGLYEVRYVLYAGRRTIARATVEVSRPEIALDVPTQVMAGSRFEVGRNATVNPRDRIVVVPMGAPDREQGPALRTRNVNPLQIDAPDAPGLYEVRYVLAEDRRVLARAPLEVTPVSATITGPEQVVSGAEFAVEWDGPGRRGDTVELVGAGVDGTLVASSVVSRNRVVRFTAPSEPGRYTLRYRLKATGEILAQTGFEVVNVAADIDAPRTAAPGSAVVVAWTGPAGGQDRIALARPDQSTFQWVRAQKVTEGGELTFDMPVEPGMLEFRYVDVANQVILARTPIEVK